MKHSFVADACACLPKTIILKEQLLIYQCVYIQYNCDSSFCILTFAYLFICMAFPFWRRMLAVYLTEWESVCHDISFFPCWHYPWNLWLCHRIWRTYRMHEQIIWALHHSNKWWWCSREITNSFVNMEMTKIPCFSFECIEKRLDAYLLGDVIYLFEEANFGYLFSPGFRIHIKHLLSLSMCFSICWVCINSIVLKPIIILDFFYL